MYKLLAFYKQDAIDLFSISKNYLNDQSIHRKFEPKLIYKLLRGIEQYLDVILIQTHQEMQCHASKAFVYGAILHFVYDLERQHLDQDKVFDSIIDSIFEQASYLIKDTDQREKLQDVFCTIKQVVKINIIHLVDQSKNVERFTFSNILVYPGSEQYLVISALSQFESQFKVLLKNHFQVKEFCHFMKPKLHELIQKSVVQLDTTALTSDTSVQNAVCSFFDQWFKASYSELFDALPLNKINALKDDELRLFNCLDANFSTTYLQSQLNDHISFEESETIIKLFKTFNNPQEFFTSAEFFQQYASALPDSFSLLFLVCWQFIKTNVI